MKKNMTLTLLVAGSIALSACATNPEQDRNNTAAGAIIGAVAGAVIGGQLDDDGNRDRGILVGALAGAAAGAGIGALMDKQEDEFRAALEEEQRRSEIEIERVREDLLKLTFDSEVTFDVNSAMLNNRFYTSLNKVSDVIQKYESEATIVGHTDSTGSDAYNQQLSDRRSTAVKVYFMERGVSPAQLSAIGKGESDPRASNESEAGRQLNRRVEIFVAPPSS